MKELIAILSGDICKDASGVWRATDLDRYTPNTVLAETDSFRVQGAAAFIKKQLAQGHEVEILATGGFATQDNPSLARVIRDNLVELGAPADIITMEEETEATHTQLLDFQTRLLAGSYGQSYVVSSGWHLPRVQAMINYYAPLAQLRDKKPVLVSAEDELASDGSWAARIKAAQEHEGLKSRIASEERGTAQIIEGTYVFKDIKPR